MQDRENGVDEDATTPSRAVTGWTVGLACMAVVMSGVIVNGLFHEPQRELTTTPVIPTAEETPESIETLYVTEPVVFPVQIPGCDVVEPPVDGRGYSMMYMESGYDNPAYPWFSGPKAGAMTNALRDALPDDIEIAFAPVRESLVFEPISGDGKEPYGIGGWTSARAAVLRGAGAGALSVTVRQSTKPIPACVAGALDERRHLADGAIVDLQDTWSETNGVRTLSRTATAYLPDGTEARANATDVTVDGEGHTGAVPLTSEDLLALVTAPGLRVTAPVPPGTPDPPQQCNVYVFTQSTAPIDEARARRVNAVLARIPLPDLTLDRPLELRPDRTGGLCQAVRVTTPGRESDLRIAITAGVVLPSITETSSNSGSERVTTRQQPDGSVVENSERRDVRVSQAGQTTVEIDRSVTVTYRSGTQVDVASSGAEPLSFAVLEAIALNPGLEVSA
ncbi:hypothetical protein [Nocardia sp. XZ_19_385]|uniref:hypothetical protein n=1 Tax=Nocardia sp. XZ_19_385 TaxID=2769488 RepID=UPI00188E40E1|nr:hypothetical protein [Nocardia sp. XZ_19_385]